MVAPAWGALAKCSPTRGSPPPGGAMAPPPAISVCQKKNWSRRPRGSLVPQISLPTIDQNKKCSASIEPSRDNEKLRSSLSSPAKFPRMIPESSPTRLNNENLRSPNCDDSKEGLNMCILCHQESTPSICNGCAARLKRSLLDVDLDAALRSAPARGWVSFCISCAELVRGSHEQHQARIIPLRPRRKSWAAWSTGYESWSSLLHGVQADLQCPSDGSDPERPYLLKPPRGSRCEVCSDIVAPPSLFGSLVRYCTIECWLSGRVAGAQLEWATALVEEDFGAGRANTFCVTCACGFRRGAACHNGHVCLSIVADVLGRRPLVHIPSSHSLASALDSVKDWAGWELHSSTIR